MPFCFPGDSYPREYRTESESVEAHRHLHLAGFPAQLCCPHLEQVEGLFATRALENGVKIKESQLRFQGASISGSHRSGSGNEIFKRTRKERGVIHEIVKISSSGADRAIIHRKSICFLDQFQSFCFQYHSLKSMLP